MWSPPPMVCGIRRQGLNDSVKAGALLGRLEDLSGRCIQEVRAEFDGVVLYYTAGLGVAAGDPLIAYGHP